MHKFLFFLVTAILLATPTWVQAQESGRSYISTLSSNDYAGRGYVKKGLSKAAKFIRHEMKHAGVEAAAKNYFQLTPTFQVNSFPSLISFEEISSGQNRSIVAYRAGKDFLLNPGSGDINLKAVKILKIDDNYLFSTFNSNSAYYIQQSNFNGDKLKALENFLLESDTISNSLLIIYDTTKLTWYPSMQKSNNAILYINQPLEGENINAGWKTHLKTDFQGINVIGKVSGDRSDSSIYFTAHYDHLGMLGDHIFPGANDNASGVAMLLDMAKYYAKNKPTFDTYFLFTCGEELGLLGSYFYINSPLSPLEQIKLLINLDMVGTGEEGITIVNAKKQKRFFNLMTNNNNGALETIKARGEACNSDHCLFDRAGVPSVFIYTLGGKQAYHDIYDNGEDLSLHAYEELMDLLIKTLKNY